MKLKESHVFLVKEYTNVWSVIRKKEEHKKLSLESYIILIYKDEGRRSDTYCKRLIPRLNKASINGVLDKWFVADIRNKKVYLMNSDGEILEQLDGWLYKGKWDDGTTKINIKMIRKYIREISSSSTENKSLSRNNVLDIYKGRELSLDIRTLLNKHSNIII